MKPTYEELEAKCLLQQNKLDAINKLMGVIEGASDLAKSGIEKLEQQLAAVVAENAGLKMYRPQPGGAAMMEALDTFYEYHEDVPEQGMMEAFEILCCKRPATPATDAFLAEVRAQGVDALNIQFKKCSGMLYADSVIETAAEFAAQLRQGAAL